MYMIFAYLRKGTRTEQIRCLYSKGVYSKKTTAEKEAKLLNARSNRPDNYFVAKIIVNK